MDNRLRYNYCYNMTIQTKVRKIGNSYGIVLPKEALHAMKVKEGDAIYLTDGPGCSMRMTPASPDFKKMMEFADKGMRKYRNALSELAK